MKSFILIFLFGFNFTVFAQTSQIANLLNEQFQKEYNKYLDEYDREMFQIVKPFEIDSDNNLTFTFISKSSDEDYDQITRKVNLSKIKQIDKDYNVVFVTDNDDVEEITIQFRNGTKRELTQKMHIFQTEINREPKNSKFRDKIIKSFKKSGFIISSEYWWD